MTFLFLSLAVPAVFGGRTKSCVAPLFLVGDLQVFEVEGVNLQKQLQEVGWSRSVLQDMPVLLLPSMIKPEENEKIYTKTNKLDALIIDY